MDIYVGQKFRHKVRRVDDTFFNTIYCVHAIKENQVALEVLESDRNHRIPGTLVSITDNTVSHMLNIGSFELINDTFEIET